MSPAEYVLRDIPDWERAEDLDAYMMLPRATPRPPPAAMTAVLEYFTTRCTRVHTLPVTRRGPSGDSRLLWEFIPEGLLFELYYVFMIVMVGKGDGSAVG